jgi:hypothetical protein
VAAKGNKVVAVSDSHQELIKELEKREFNRVCVSYSESPQDKEYRFLFHVQTESLRKVYV